jgi:hypothetical protein
MTWLAQALRVTPPILLVIGSVFLGACGSDGDEPSAREKHAAAQAAKKGVHVPKVNEDVDMVAAPSSSKTPGAVALKFVVTKKPVVGTPVDIRLALIPTPDLLRIAASFQASEGLELRSGAKTPTFEKPEAGTSINHTLTVVPNNNGIFYITAIILSDSETSSVARTFTIPIIAGEGLSAKPANTATPSVAGAPAAKSRQSE